VIDELIAAFYAAFDNREGRVPDGAALVALFAPEARVTHVGETVSTWTPEEFVAPRIRILTDGTLTDFHEWETSSRTDVFGDIATRWSTYEKPGGGGTKLFQLRREGERWLIGSLLWQDG
jgi:hypothetical protein